MMSFCDMYSYWRCPSCQNENVYSLTWQHFYEFHELPEEIYSKEKCAHCGKEYYVNSSEPNPYCFKAYRGKCKNDYIKNMVIPLSGVTIINEFWTT